LNSCLGAYAVRCHRHVSFGYIVSKEFPCRYEEYKEDKEIIKKYGKDIPCLIIAQEYKVWDKVNVLVSTYTIKNGKRLGIAETVYALGNGFAIKNRGNRDVIISGNVESVKLKNADLRDVIGPNQQVVLIYKAY